MGGLTPLSGSVNEQQKQKFFLNFFKKDFATVMILWTCREVLPPLPGKHDLSPSEPLQPGGLAAVADAAGAPRGGRRAARALQRPPRPRPLAAPRGGPGLVGGGRLGPGWRCPLPAPSRPCHLPPQSLCEKWVADRWMACCSLAQSAPKTSWQKPKNAKAPRRRNPLAGMKGRRRPLARGLLQTRFQNAVRLSGEWGCSDGCEVVCFSAEPACMRVLATGVLLSIPGRRRSGRFPHRPLLFAVCSLFNLNTFFSKPGSVRSIETGSCCRRA